MIDAGAIRPLAGREVIDLMGLTSPEFLALSAGKATGVKIKYPSMLEV